MLEATLKKVVVPGHIILSKNYHFAASYGSRFLQNVKKATKKNKKNNETMICSALPRGCKIFQGIQSKKKTFPNKVVVWPKLTL